MISPIFDFFFGVDDRQPATAVADNGIAGARINTDIVGVITQRQAPGGREILAAEKTHRAIAGAGDGHEIRFLGIAHALRLAQSRDLLDPAPGREIHDIESAVPECRHQQPFATEVDGHVIDPPGDPGQRDLAFERQGFFGSCRGGNHRQSE